jgi:U3 small nucleolar RNA-associated protein 6
MTYLQYTKTSKALRKFKTVLTSALRMHPTKASLWLYAARSALELDSDMDGARSYMQRGTRFCPASRELWIEFAKLEMFYLAKISARRRILGLDKSRQIEPPKDVEQSAEEEVGFADDADEIRIPDFKQDTLQSGMMEGVKVDTDAAQDPMNTPALNGAIPIAIYDHVRKQPFFNMGVAEEFFDMFASFTQVHCVTKILQHVVDSMNDAQATDPSAANCYIRQPVAGVDVHTAEFPVALALALERLKQCQQTTTDIGQLSSKVTAWMEQLLAVNGLDEGIATVIQHTLRKLGQ